MTTGSILLGIALLLLVILILAQPLISSRREWQARLTKKQVLEEEKDAILEQIRDLDFDYETGKMPTEVYEAQRTHLMTEAAAILQQIEELAPGEAVKTAVPTNVDAEIEAAIAQMRRAPAPSGQVQVNGQGGFCPNCGHPVDSGDNFCTTCGHKLSQKQSVS